MDSQRDNRLSPAMVICWVAWISGGLAAAFLLMMIAAHLFDPKVEGGGMPSAQSLLAIAFFPVGLTVGLVLAYFKEPAGGLVTVGCILIWHLIMQIQHGNPDFMPFIDGLAVPGLLYVIAWYLSRKAGGRQHQAQEN